MNLAELVQEQLKALPPDQVREVLDFIGYLKVRHERQEWDDLIQAQHAALTSVWDNSEDEVWNRV